MASQEPVQGVTPQTQVQKVRIIRLKSGEYNMLRSFVDSSIKDDYSWRLGYEWNNKFMWRKERRWVLTVYKYAKNLSVKKLPTEGIYKVLEKVVQPVAILESLKSNAETWFVMANELGIYYSAGKLVFTRRAPVMFMPKASVPFARPIMVYEVLDTLDYYFTF
jgi:hypothetical protein